MAAYDGRITNSTETLMLRIKTHLFTLLLCTGFGLISWHAPSLASNTKTTKETTAKKPKKEKKAKGQKAGGVTFYEGSGESRAERERRLMRECRGRPNSGLCEGFARP